MSLASEIAADIASGTDFNDLFEAVTWGATSFSAMVEDNGVEESFDQFGGSTLKGQKVFKFRRADLVAESDDLTMLGDKITYATRIYDVQKVNERPSWPIVTVNATLRS